MVTNASNAGIDPAKNICRNDHSWETMMPPNIGPTIDPMRPTPKAHPTPVDLIDVG